MNKPIVFKLESKWLEARAKVVTATEASSLFSLNPYTSAKKMRRRKTHPEFQENAYTFLGKVLEPAVVKAMNLLTNRQFELFEGAGEDKLFFIHPKHRLGATPDAIYEDTLLECKTTSEAKFDTWEVAPPLYYLMQVHVQMLCTGLKQGALTCIPTNLSPKSFNSKFPIHSYFIESNLEIDNLILDTVDRFWDNVSKDEEFEVNREDVRRMKSLLLHAMTKLPI